MSVFTHGVTTKGKPWLINRNQVFTVALRRKLLSNAAALRRLTARPEDPQGDRRLFARQLSREYYSAGLFPPILLNPLYCAPR